MALSFDECNIGTYIGGSRFCGRYASGIISSVFPGLGFLVDNEGYQYLIINNFQVGGHMVSHSLEFRASDCSSIPLTDETILFWLKGGCRTKSKVYGIEITRHRLINPMSDEGLRLPTKLNPFICSALYVKGMEKRANWAFMKSTGGDYPETPGDQAPLPLDIIYMRAVEKQENQWHLARARILNEDEAKPYKYTFLQCGKKLLIELDGVKKSTVNYKDGEVHLYTPAHSVVCSPAQPFVLAPPPFLPPLGLEDPLWGGDNRFVEGVKRLTDQQIEEGIEEAHWEMKRIRVMAEATKAQLGVDFMNTQKWLDAAYDEKQARRDEIVFQYTGIV
jgi:hypothetical protein